MFDDLYNKIKNNFNYYKKYRKTKRKTRTNRLFKRRDKRM